MGCIYRLFNEAGDTLYVGMTKDANPGRRFSAHCKVQTWRDEIAGVEIMRRDVPQEALCSAEAEVASILDPRYGNWSRFGLDGIAPSTPRRDPLVSVCPYAVRLAVSRCGVTLAEAAMRRVLPMEWPALINAGKHVVATPVVVGQIAESVGIHPRELVHQWEPGVAA
jgi:hypothetical protein